MIQQPFVKPTSTLLGTRSDVTYYTGKTKHVDPNAVDKTPTQDTVELSKKKDNKKKWLIAGGIALTTIGTFLGIKYGKSAINFVRGLFKKAPAPTPTPPPAPAP